MNLIANTGIQLTTVSWEINLEDDFKMYFHEWIDDETQKYNLEIAHYLSSENIWLKKLDLFQLGYVVNGNVDIKRNGKKVSNPWENLLEEDFRQNDRSLITEDSIDPEDTGCFTQNIQRIKWEKIENKWLPMPFFELTEKGRSKFGPNNWCRFKLIPKQSTDKKVKKYQILLAFDTRVTDERDKLTESPSFIDGFKEFSLPNDEFKIIDYVSEAHNSGWVDKVLLKNYHNVNRIKDLQVNETIKTRYLAEYIFLIRYIQKEGVINKVILHSDKKHAAINVDMAIDIGNSRTCAVLFENGNFAKASPLALQNYTNPTLKNKLNVSREPFDMRLVFREIDFGGDFGIKHSKQFTNISIVRLGDEARDLIHLATNSNTTSIRKSTFSSPKRYLWDSTPQLEEWGFIQLDGEKHKPIYIKGLSEQLNSDGTLNFEGKGGQTNHYSKKTLMTFAFVEIFSQAYTQINSATQREHWGDETIARKLRNIIVTCPTAMSKVEQIELRKCAEDASIILKRYFDETFDMPVDEKVLRSGINVVPSYKNLAKKEDKSEWIYDEATAAQFVFLYAEIAERYLNNSDDYFKIYGKVRNDLEDYHKESLTIGSIDIGAGTTDVMITAYKQDQKRTGALIPVPLFWETFHLAGDDLMKNIIHQLILEGEYSPIENKLQQNTQLTRDRIIKLKNDFFGGNTGMSVQQKQMRNDFNLQVSLTITQYYLELLKNNQTDKELSYKDIFKTNNPTKTLIDYFESHFGFSFTELKWKYNKNKLSTIVEKTFDNLMGKISSLFSYYQCDIVLLSGRPTSLKPLTDLFLKYYAISPNRLKTMNDYRVGKWYPEDKRYPFLDGSGYFINPKSIVTTGAMIGYYASNNNLKGFSLNLNELIEKLEPTTEYFGRVQEDLSGFDKADITPDNNRTDIKNVNYLPAYIASKQIDSISYPSRPFYSLLIDENVMLRRAIDRLEGENDINKATDIKDTQINNIRNRMPLTVFIERDYNEDKEKLIIESVVDKDGEELNTRAFTLQVQSMESPDSFWLDTGIFNTEIK